MTSTAPRRSHAGTPRESRARHRARESALQMLYLWEVGRLPMSEVGDAFRLLDKPVGELPAEGQAFAARLAAGAAARVTEIDVLIVEAAEHWRIERMSVIDRLILRLAAFELLAEDDTPGKVVIDEALELARTYSGDEAVGFVNGILDAICRRLGRV